jgi:L-rhamnose-H+ transport protein
MSFIILVSNGWGVVLNEWKGADRKTLAIFIIGLFLILGSVVFVGYGSLLLN